MSLFWDFLDFYDALTAVLFPDTSVMWLKTSMFELKITELFRLSNENNESFLMKLALGPVGFFTWVLVTATCVVIFFAVDVAVNGDFGFFFGRISFW